MRRIFKISIIIFTLSIVVPACRSSTITISHTAATAQPADANGIAVTFPDYSRRLLWVADGDLALMHTNGSSQPFKLPPTPYYESMPAWSNNGKYVAYVSGREGNDDIFLASFSALGDTDQHINLTKHVAQDRAPAWSPDGRTLAFSSDRYRNWGIFVMELLLSDSAMAENPVLLGPIRRTYNQRYDGHPAWSPDGGYIAYTSDQGYRWQVYWMKRNGADQQAFPGTDALGSTAYPAWSPDGTRLAFASNYEGNWNIYTLDRQGGNLLRLSHHPADDWWPRWSPDGQWLAFVSMRSGNGDVYLVKADGSEESRLTNQPTPDLFPVWEP